MYIKMARKYKNVLLQFNMHNSPVVVKKLFLKWNVDRISWKTKPLPKFNKCWLRYGQQWRNIKEHINKRECSSFYWILIYSIRFPRCFLSTIMKHIYHLFLDILYYFYSFYSTISLLLRLGAKTASTLIFIAFSWGHTCYIAFNMPWIFFLNILFLRDVIWKRYVLQEGGGWKIQSIFFPILLHVGKDLLRI